MPPRLTDVEFTIYILYAPLTNSWKPIYNFKSRYGSTMINYAMHCYSISLRIPSARIIGRRYRTRWMAIAKGGCGNTFQTPPPLMGLGTTLGQVWVWSLDRAIQSESRGKPCDLHRVSHLRFQNMSLLVVFTMESFCERVYWPSFVEIASARMLWAYWLPSSFKG